MRKLMLILIAFIAIVTFIKAFDYTGDIYTGTGSGVSGTKEDLEFDY